MKKKWALSVLVIGMFGLAGVAFANSPHIYKWVKDKNVSSDQVLKEAQTSRVVALSETAALNAVRKVMVDDLYMALAEYHKTKHRQDGETVKDTVLPESVVGKQEIDLVDENYRFVLEVRLKAAENGRTRVLVKASPMYRIRDLEKEDERNDTRQGDSTVEMKINAPQGTVVDMHGGIYIEPLIGLPMDYQIETLSDAADRAQKLVRSFLYLLDRRVAGSAQ
jgi:hypothetical protein